MIRLQLKLRSARNISVHWLWSQRRERSKRVFGGWTSGRKATTARMRFARRSTGAQPGAKLNTVAMWSRSRSGRPSWDTFRPKDQAARTGRFPCPPCGVFAGIAAISRFQNSRLGLCGPHCPGDSVCILRCWSWCARTLELDARCADFRGSPGPICREPRTTAHYVLGGCRSIFVHRISTSIDRLCRFYAALAQPVEHVIRNDGVACSSHASGTIVFKGLQSNSGPSYERSLNQRVRGRREARSSPLSASLTLLST